jgi:hypothetical protein
LRCFLRAYRIWADERNQLVAMELHLAPRVRLEFDPNRTKFVSPTDTIGDIKMLYVRVLARAISPVVRNCQVYLQQISQWNGEKYIVLFDETLPVPWSYENPESIHPKLLNHDVDRFADVAWFAEPRWGLTFWRSEHPISSPDAASRHHTKRSSAQPQPQSQDRPIDNW